MRRCPIKQPWTTASRTLYGKVWHSTKKAIKFKSKDGAFCWIPKAAIKSTFKAGQQLEVYNWFQPSWLS